MKKKHDSDEEKRQSGDRLIKGAVPFFKGMRWGFPNQERFVQIRGLSNDGLWSRWHYFYYISRFQIMRCYNGCMKWKTAHDSVRIGGIILVWSLGIATIAVNLLLDPFVFPSQERHLQQTVLVRPFHSQSHEALGAYYQAGNIPVAQREYILAQSLLENRSPQTTDTSSSVHAWNTYQQKQQQLTEERQVWERIYTTVPEYQYAAVKLAQLSYQAGDLPGARKYVLIAREQMPWNETVASFAAVLR